VVQNTRLIYTILLSADKQVDFGYPLPDIRVSRRAAPALVAIIQGYRYLGEREEPVCTLYLTSPISDFCLYSRGFPVHPL